jgi:hypothetical protein
MHQAAVLIGNPVVHNDIRRRRTWGRGRVDRCFQPSPLSTPRFPEPAIGVLGQDASFGPSEVLELSSCSLRAGTRRGHA